VNVTALPTPYPDGRQPASQGVSSVIERLQLEHEFGPWLVYVLVAGAVLAFAVCKSYDDLAFGLEIGVACAAPAYVWAKRGVLGLPIFPTIAVMYFAFYGLPFITGHPFTEQYTNEEKFAAASTTSGVILIATVIWFQIGRSRARRPQVIRVINEHKATRFFQLGLALGVVFQLQSLFGLFLLSSEVYGVARAILQSLALVSVLGLSYQVAAGHLTRPQAVIFVTGLLSYLTLSLIGLYLIGGLEVVMLATLGYFLGRGKPPWKSIFVAIAVFSVLNAGKTTIREEYWSDEGTVTFRQAGPMLQQWFEEGFNNIFGERDPESRNVSLAERASLTQMVLIAETQTPELVPFLYGASYVAIPELLVPRLIWPERPTTQETLRLMSEHYGLLTADTVQSTSIGWGLISEVYANFGFIGCAGLGVVLGFLFGFIQRWCGRAPVLSARALLAFLFTMVALRVETNAALLVTALLQSMVALVLTTIFVMESVEVEI